MSALNVKNKPLVIGLTGGIATGKTTVANYLVEKGFLVADSDLIVNDLYLHDKALINEIEETFKIDFKSPTCRKTLGNIIFNNEESKELLNAIVHPKVFLKLVDFIKNNSGEKVLFLDIPLLYESKMDNLCDFVILVYVEEDEQISRLMRRNNLTKEDALLRINAQMPLAKKALLANFVINNNEDIKSLYKQVDKVVEAIINESK